MGAEAQGEGERVTLMVYNSANVPAGVLKHAGMETTRIFQIAGIRVVWVNCKSGTEERCRINPAQRDQFILHIVHDGKTSQDSVFGEAFVGDDENGKYADIFFDRVEEAHRASGAETSDLLGAVAAHELGHLLLGLKAHSWVGLMAPVWQRDSLHLITMGSLLFTPQQAVRMRERLRGFRTNFAAAGRKRDY
jgi:hypothetical protein